jgi:hypothetical protein
MLKCVAMLAAPPLAGSVPVPTFDEPPPPPAPPQPPLPKDHACELDRVGILPRPSSAAP